QFFLNLNYFSFYDAYCIFYFIIFSSTVAMRFMEVLTKSVCRPIEKLVNVEGEFPDGVEYIYIPSCVPLFRCSGCCIDETKECYPTTKRNITLEVRTGQGRAQIPLLNTLNINMKPHHSPTPSCPQKKKKKSTI
uniref:Platelet-derived growth factor (PDGF) family profile domain-containing protein n=1 Tax=Fundulus heteroclitus TaxID=8078 RepID=A0A3Q2ULZ7_FUNHE